MADKQKIIIINNNLRIGGIQKALVNLLNEIKDEYDVTLFIFSYSGEYKKYIPNEINVIEANKFMRLLGISQKESVKEGVFYYILRSFLVLWTKFFSNSVPFRLLIFTQKKLKNYDVAISYLQSSNDRSFYGGCNEFVLRKVDAKKKIAFIHSDFLNYGGNTPKNRKKYRKFDKVAAVSNGCKDNIIKAIPEIAQDTLCVKNCHNYSEIQQKANESPVEYNPEIFNLVTVARLSKEKGINRTIEVIAELIKKKYNIHWHVIGEGDQRKEIEAKMSLYSLEKNITLYGNQDNPYRYMKNADLFLLPSYHEAAPMVFEEAKFLGLPVLASETTSSKEMIEDCNAGWVCENSTEGIQERLEYILNNIAELQEIRQKLMGENSDNKQALKHFNYVLRGDI